MPMPLVAVWLPAQRVALSAQGRMVIAGGTASRIAVLRRRLDALSDDDRRRIREALPALASLVTTACDR